MVAAVPLAGNDSTSPERPGRSVNASVADD